MKFELFVDEEVLNKKANTSKFGQFLVNARNLVAWPCWLGGTGFSIFSKKEGVCVYFGEEETARGYSITMSTKDAKLLAKALTEAVAKA